MSNFTSKLENASRPALAVIVGLVLSLLTPVGAAFATPAELGPAVQVDANCGSVASPVACTTSAISPSNTTRKLAVTSDGSIFALFYGPEGIRVAKSTDRGLTFGVAVQVSADNVQAEIAVSNNDYLYVVWVNQSQDVKFARSTDGGQTWLTQDIGSLSGFGFGQSVHMAVDGEYIYLIDQNTTTWWVSSDAGNSFTSRDPNIGNWVFSDVVVDSTTNDVYAFVDDPDVSWFLSTDRGQTFGPEVSTGQAVYFSVAAISSGASGRYMYMAGQGGNLERVDLASTSSPVLTVNVAASDQSQGRSLAADAFGNVVSAAIVSTSSQAEIVFQVSNDFGVSFSSEISLATHSDLAKTWLNVAINTTNGDLMFLYQLGDDIYFKTFTGYLVGYDLGLSLSAINLGAANELKTVVLTNVGQSSITLSNIALRDGDFTISATTCGANLATASSCAITVTGATPADDVLQITAENAVRTVTRNVPVSLGALAASGQLPVNQFQPAAAPSYDPPKVPILDPFQGQFLKGLELTLTGTNMELFKTIKLNGIEVSIISQSPEAIRIKLPADLALGDVLLDSVLQAGINYGNTGAIKHVKLEVIAPPSVKKFNFAGFAAGSSVVTSEMRKSITKFVREVKPKAVTCVGFTVGPKILAGDPKLATERGKAVCSIIKQLSPSTEITVKFKNSTQRDSSFRRVTLEASY